MKIVALLLVLVLFSIANFRSGVEAADVVFKNGNIYTVNEKQPRAEAIAARNGRILFVGSNADVQPYVGNGTRVVDLRGATVVPGLTDAHCHLAGIGEREMSLNLEGTASLQDLLTKVKYRVDQAKPGEWVIGRGWIETFWKPPVFPTRQELDRIAPRNPVYLTRADGHGAVVNSEALRIARIDKKTPNPFGGEISKDRDGEPNGMLLDRAQGLVSLHFPPTTQADREQAVLLGVKRSLELGWCQIQDAGGTQADVELYRKLYAAGKIKLRIYKAVHGPSPSATRLLQDGPQVSGNFTFRTIKVMFDGALGSRGAALLERYADADTSGLFIQKEETLLPMLNEALRQGIQVETHAIGDRANRRVLDLYEKAFAAVPPDQRKVREPRWRVEHAQIIHPSDIPRFAKLGVIASMQPSHAISDLHFAPRRLGMKRLEGAYAWQSLLKSGAIIAGGSDAPVERGEPMIEFYAAVARKDQKGFSGEGWHPEQAVTREQALKMFTLWPAYAAFEEKTRGSLEPGKFADLTVLSADILKIPEAEILKTRCLMTVIGGEIVTRSGEASR
jgi:predicted amidohydrolase YtcJ